MKEYLILYNDEIFDRSEFYIQAKTKKDAKKQFIKSLRDNYESIPEKYTIFKQVHEVTEYEY